MLNAFRFIIFLVVLLSTSVAYSDAAESLVINEVLLDRDYLYVDKNHPNQEERKIAVTFTISLPSKVALNIYDLRGYLVNSISAGKSLSAGRHTLVWNGLASSGRTVPVGAYFYTIEATSSDKTVVYDLQDSEEGKNIVVENINYDSELGKVSFSLSKSARIFLRVGIKDGFIVKTLVNGAYREAGNYVLDWDGWDESKAFNLKSHPNLRFYGEGYFVKRAISVRSAKPLLNHDEWLEGLSGERRVVDKKPYGLNRHAYHQPDQCKDVTVNFTVNGEDKDVVVDGVAELRVELPTVDQIIIESQRAEIVFFLDGQFLYENEISYFPYTWRWDPKAFSEGEHLLTAFIVGFGEHFGVATKKIVIKK